jgi:hypothetical protein
VGGGLRAHVMLCHNHYDLMAFTTPAEGQLRYRQDSRKLSHGHQDVAVLTGCGTTCSGDGTCLRFLESDGLPPES